MPRNRASSIGPERNRLLAEMTDEVAGLVLRNNYLQTLCLTLAVARGTEENGYAMHVHAGLEKRGIARSQARVVAEAMPRGDERGTRAAKC